MEIYVLLWFNLQEYFGLCTMMSLDCVIDTIPFRIIMQMQSIFFLRFILVLLPISIKICFISAYTFIVQSHDITISSFKKNNNMTHEYDENENIVVWITIEYSIIRYSSSWLSFRIYFLIFLFSCYINNSFEIDLKIG